MRGAAYYDLDLVLRLDHAPQWALVPGAAVDVQSYARFVARVADRYRGKVGAYVIWNEPNLAVEWAGRAPDPAGYVALLCAAGAAIHEADPEALVVSAGLAPTNRNDDTALDDRRFLEAIYAAGAASCFLQTKTRRPHRAAPKTMIFAKPLITSSPDWKTPPSACGV